MVMLMKTSAASSQSKLQACQMLAKQENRRRLLQTLPVIDQLLSCTRPVLFTLIYLLAYLLLAYPHTNIPIHTYTYLFIPLHTYTYLYTYIPIYLHTYPAPDLYFSPYLPSDFYHPMKPFYAEFVLSLFFHHLFSQSQNLSNVTVIPIPIPLPITITMPLCPLNPIVIPVSSKSQAPPHPSH